MKPCNSLALNGIQYALQKNQFIDLPSTGISMYPFIQEGDICTFIQVSSSLKKGDVVLFVSDEGILVGHRYQYSYVEGGQSYYVFKGDTNVMPDPPVVSDQLIGKLARVRKKGVSFHHDGRASRFWGFLVGAFPAFPRWCKSLHYYKQRLKTRLKERNHA